MTYTYQGKSPAVQTADEIHIEMERLQHFRAAILAETTAKEKELARIRAARKRLEPIATYTPTPEALAYREQYGHIIAAQPAPVYGGSSGLGMATREAASWDRYGGVLVKA